MIVQNVSEDGFTDLTFTVQSADFDRAVEVLRKARDKVDYADLRGSTDIAKVSAIGVGMRSHAGVAAQMFSALAEKGINIEAISTSEIKISVLIDAAYAELAVRTCCCSTSISTVKMAMASVPAIRLVGPHSSHARSKCWQRSGRTTSGRRRVPVVLL
jgi:predicted amino acid-binding ACT domain protein